MSSTPRTLFDKVWDAHVVVHEDGCPAVLYADLHLVHEVTSPQAFTGLRARALPVRRPDRTLATMDHSTSTLPRGVGIFDLQAQTQLEKLEENCADFAIRLLKLGDERRGIVHVIGPELGLTQPGMTIVCGDSHTSTHGAFGALAFGIGTSEVEHVLATQCLLQAKPLAYEVRLEGSLPAGITAKDIILALIAKIGVNGAVGHVLEYSGSAIKALDMEGRMTICNMSIEAGARAGMIAPDNTTFEYLSGREFSPRAEAWDRAVNRWSRLATDEGAEFDRRTSLDISALQPMITYGTNPGMAHPISAPVPDPAAQSDPGRRSALEKALKYMDLRPGQPVLDHKVDVIFIGSCTNGRISDIRLAASLLKDRKVFPGVRLLVVPGSEAVRRQAELEGLDRVIIEAGGEWRLAGCSMCIAMNGDQLQPGEYAVSTSNRNFEGRQGPLGRTFLASPLTAAASAVRGRVTDARTLLSVS